VGYGYPGKTSCEPPVAVGGVEVTGVGDLGEAIQVVVLIRRLGVLGGAVGAVVVVDGLRQAIQGVVAQLALDAQAIGALHQVAVGVISFDRY